MECGGLPPLSRSSVPGDQTPHARLATRAKTASPSPQRGLGATYRAITTQATAAQAPALERTEIQMFDFNARKNQLCRADCGDSL